LEDAFGKGIGAKQLIMKNYLLSFITFFFAISVFSQTDSTASEKKVVPSIATVKTLDGKTVKGWFYKMNDENIYLLPVKKNKKYFRSSDFLSPDVNAGSFNIQVSQINTIALQKKNAGWKGILIGLGAGVVTGALLGFISGDNPIQECGPNDFFCLGAAINNAFAMTAGEKALAGALGLGLAGSLTGFILSKVAKKKFIIGGQKDTYRNLQGELMTRLIIK
jgi:hypothetical protein